MISSDAGYLERLAAAAETVTARISDGNGRWYARAPAHAALAGAALGLSMTAIVSLAAATTLRGQVALFPGDGIRLATTAASKMTAIRIG